MYAVSGSLFLLRMLLRGEGMKEFYTNCKISWGKRFSISHNHNFLGKKQSYWSSTEGVPQICWIFIGISLIYKSIQRVTTIMTNLTLLIDLSLKLWEGFFFHLYEPRVVSHHHLENTSQIWSSLQYKFTLTYMR